MGADWSQHIKNDLEATLQTAPAVQLGPAPSPQPDDIAQGDSASTPVPFLLTSLTQPAGSAEHLPAMPKSQKDGLKHLFILLENKKVICGNCSV